MSLLPARDNPLTCAFLQKSKPKEKTQKTLSNASHASPRPPLKSQTKPENFWEMFLGVAPFSSIPVAGGSMLTGDET